ncbi:LysM peptidoglycan-binding domain-containing protein [Clostridium beijerinckii]|uniref:LysM peptidoglycan-binding domain-containing protein n=1 Tax=Clostridium beijerinckii TaxID=1520 RepID=A0AAW3WBM5_CLOBE|nr:LysM peptidoglycan-binding domain-containing protein [Clostridium beijerinckii]MBC2455828.1 LysM peptidoglycan-binding domain-containing protein [Clostridium beijerinckii]MBC2475883.1 LysM peptidoglycan-binding domain-containing protein [Clostridium beijerinckii]MDG5852951.1 LysM peptidoglycan-binding domain-containing protein [Clostridium beijerinckii]NOV61778.1 hypothetical protein [Clostridium beijerinckii]NOV68726.1 hypothetical protein [Clostridium beijerinckii]
MIRKLMPLIVILCVFTAVLLSATFYKTEKSTTSSTENKNINTDISVKPDNTTNELKSFPKTETSNKSEPNKVANEMQVVKEQKANSEIRKTDIDISNYLSSLQCISHRLQQGETLTDVARKYESTCNLNSTIKIIKSINKIDDVNNMNSQAIVNIPENALKSGTMYTVAAGNTWYKLANKYYPEHTVESVMKFLVYINNLPNNDLPLGEKIFLPSL